MFSFGKLKKGSQDIGFDIEFWQYGFTGLGFRITKITMLRNGNPFGHASKIYGIKLLSFSIAITHNM